MKYAVLALALFFSSASYVQACANSPEQIQGEFAAADTDNSGYLTLEEYYGPLDRREGSEGLIKMPMEKRKIFINALDLNKDGQISFDEFRKNRAQQRCGKKF
jgi:Ca2+-binding EF-hand superfamily protein